jgi:hypothetical protein
MRRYRARQKAAAQREAPPVKPLRAVDGLLVAQVEASVAALSGLTEADAAVVGLARSLAAAIDGLPAELHGVLPQLAAQLRLTLAELRGRAVPVSAPGAPSRLQALRDARKNYPA